jgi:hypothetical protein
LGRWLNADDVSYLEPESINGLNLYTYCGNNPIMRADPFGTSWFSSVGDWFSNNWEYIAGALIIIGVVALSFATAGLAAPIAASLGGGLFGAIAGGAIAGFGISVGMQGITNGFNNLDWNQVGKATLSGAISGFVAGGVFGGLQKVYSASRLSGLSKAQGNLDNVFKPLESVKALSGSFSSGTNIARTVGSVASNYNTAYRTLFNAQVLNFVIKNELYPGAKFAFKQLVGFGINQIL